MKESNQNNDLINPIEFIKSLKNNKKIILLFFYGFIIVGLFLTIFTRNKYIASTIIIPQTTSQTGIGGSIGGLADIVGVDLSNMGGESGISPQVYPQILGSASFLKELLNVQIYFSDQQSSKISYEDFYTKEYKLGVLEYLRKYTIGLPGIIIKAIKGVDNSVLRESERGMFIRINSKEKKLIEQIQDQLHLNINKKDGYISLYAEMPTARSAAEFTKAAQDLLQKYIIDFKIQKSQSQLNFIQDRFKEKEKAFKKVQNELAIYRDKNQNVNSAIAITRLEQLQSEYNLAYDVYAELAKQLEKQQIKVKEDTPVFTVIQPVSVPIEKSSPRRLYMLLTWTFLGVFVGLSFVFLKLIFTKIKSRFKDKFLEL